ncbi:MAG: NADH-quinone oxidoreductase subunit N [Aaplasma endosymbiont of Hyalomma asiaticum]
MYLSGLAHILPELVILGSALVLLIVGMFVGEKWVRVASSLSVVAAAVISYVEYRGFSGPGSQFFSGFIMHTEHTYLARLVVCVSCIFSFLLFLSSSRKCRYEFSVVMLFAVLGSISLVIANHFLSFCLSLELIGFASYILVCFDRDSKLASEAAIKFFILGALSSCITLYGISLVYVYATSFEFGVLASILEGRESLGATLGCAFILTGILFKLGSVPFHMWLPDTYQGAPTVAVALFTIVTKTAVVLAFAKIIQGIGVMSQGFKWAMLLAASLSMIVGELCAMQQNNIKRLFAYANIGHLGYVLAGICGGYELTFGAVLYYVVSYILINVWLFSVLLRYGDNGFEISSIGGMGKKNPVMALSFVSAMLAAAGLPPFSGFFAKYTLLKAIVGAGALDVPVLACVVLLCITSIVPCFYSFRIARVVYFTGVTENYPVVSRSAGLSAIAFISVMLSVIIVLSKERLEAVFSLCRP